MSYFWNRPTVRAPYWRPPLYIISLIALIRGWLLCLMVWLHDFLRKNDQLLKMPDFKNSFWNIESRSSILTGEWSPVVAVPDRAFASTSCRFALRNVLLFCCLNEQPNFVFVVLRVLHAQLVPWLLCFCGWDCEHIKSIAFLKKFQNSFPCYTDPNKYVDVSDALEKRNPLGCWLSSIAFAYLCNRSWAQCTSHKRLVKATSSSQRCVLPVAI